MDNNFIVKAKKGEYKVYFYIQQVSRLAARVQIYNISPSCTIRLLPYLLRSWKVKDQNPKREKNNNQEPHRICLALG